MPLPEPTRAQTLPIASVLVDSGLLHIDQEFEFLIPQELSQVITRGSLVKIPFNRKRVLGVVINRSEHGNFRGQLRYINEVVRDFPVITPEILDLAGEIVRYYGGNRWDVLRFAVPSFTKKSTVSHDANADTPQMPQQESKTSTSFEDQSTNYPEGFWKAFANSSDAIPRVRALWTAPPAINPLAFLVTLAERSNGRVLFILPDATDVRRFINLLRQSQHIVMSEVIEWSSELTRQDREQNFLKALMGSARIIVGVRGALLLPVPQLHSIVLWDEGNQAFEELRAPYFHAREVAIMRAHRENCHLVLGSAAPSVAAVQYIKNGYLTPLRPYGAFISGRTPQIVAISNEQAPQQQGLLPTIAWEIVKKALKTGPVLVQVPQRGYIPALSCRRCRNFALCECGGRLTKSANSDLPVCALCSVVPSRWKCKYCNAQEFRHSQVGDERVAQMLGKSFPNQMILSVNAQQRVIEIDAEPRIVVSTPGSEPLAEGGYHAALVLNAAITLERATLRAEEDSRQNWFGLATLLTPNAPLFIDAPATNRNIHALIRWDALTVALSELAERAALNLPPAIKAIEVSGTHAAVLEIIRDLPSSFLRSQPRVQENQSVALLRFTGTDRAGAVTEILKRARNQSAQGVSIARIRVDPTSL